MHLRTKLTLGVLLATIAAFGLLGYLAIISSKAAVRDRADERLLADLPTIVDAVDAGDTPPPDYLIAIVPAAGGEPRVVQQSGADDDRDPVPSATELATLIDDTNGTDNTVDYLVTDGFLYRATLGDTDQPGAGQLVVATPVDDITDFVDDLIQRLLIVAGLVSVALGAVVFWWIRRSTRPIEHIIDRAEAIADGDPDRNLVVHASTTELRTLSTSLHSMVESIDASLAVRTASEARLRQFIADASHELRTPLTTISGYLQLDHEGALATRDEHQRAIGRAIAEAARMGRIVGDLQLLAELDHGAPTFTATVDLAHLATDAVLDANAIDGDRSYEVGHCASTIVTGNPDHLRQVLANLFANVRTHTPAGTRASVSVDADHAGGTARVVVTDDGPGVDADQLGQLFDRFWRADRARTRASGGSGLGLAIVASLVDAHGGTVAAHRRPGGGLEVTFEVPLARAYARESRV